MEWNDRKQLFLWHQSGKDKKKVLSFASNNLLFKMVSRLTLLKFTIKELLWAETIMTPSPEQTANYFGIITKLSVIMSIIS